MIKIKLPFTVIALTVLIASCNPATPIPTAAIHDTPALSQSGLPVTEADVPRVTVDETVAAMQNSEAVIVDVRSAQGYQDSHIPGALSIPLFDIESNPTGVKLDKDQWIITYCT